MAFYSYATLATAQADLAARLYDSGQQFWPPAELASYIVEALREFNALTSFWRAEFPLTLQQGAWWYDITDTAQAPNTLRPFTVKDSDLISQINYHLLEPQLGAYPISWAGSKQFSLADILGALQRRRDEVLSATGCQVSRLVVEATPGRIILPDTSIDIRRVGWFPAGFIMTWDSSSPLTWDQATFTWDTAPSGQSPVILRPADAWGKQAFDLGYTVAGESPPQTYLQSTQPPLSFDVDRVPPTPGAYDIMLVKAGGNLSASAASLVGLPDDWSWLAKWGALADLLGRESNAKDMLRAKYSMQRFNEGLGVLNESPAVLSARLNNIPLQVDAVTSGDDFNVGWQGAAQGPPMRLYLAGLNMIGFAPAPDSQPYGAVLSVVQNMPVPIGGGDLIQVGRDDYDSVLDEAQHLAMYKAGGTEFSDTFPLHANFIKRCTVYNSKLRTLGQFQKPIYEISQLDEERHPRYAEPEALVG